MSVLYHVSINNIEKLIFSPECFEMFTLLKPRFQIMLKELFKIIERGLST